MPTDWQSIVGLLAVAGAAWFLVRRGLAVFRSGTKPGSACGSCGSCTSRESAAPETRLVSPLQNFTRTPQQDKELFSIDLPRRDAP
jgi:hypothetical protein